MPILVRPKPKLAVPTQAEKKAFSMEGSEIGAVVQQITARYKSAEIARMSGSTIPFEARISCGAFALDLALAGGFVRSRGSMFYGEKSSGKTTEAMKTCINAQIMFPDEIPVWIDLEGTFDKTWFAKLGGDNDRLMLVEPESGEHAVDIADALVRSKETSVIVTDSIAMLVPMKELESSSEDQMMGVHARLIGNYLRKVNNAMLVERHRGHRPLVLHINQFRMKIGLVFGDPRTLPGGKALEFCTSQQVEMKNKEIIVDGGADSGEVKWNEHSFKITKDKTGGRIREGQFKLVRSPTHCNGLPEGYIDSVKTVIASADRLGMVSGQLEIQGFGKHRGADEWREYFFKNPEAYVACQQKIINGFRKNWGLPVADE